MINAEAGKNFIGGSLKLLLQFGAAISFILLGGVALIGLLAINFF